MTGWNPLSARRFQRPQLHSCPSFKNFTAGPNRVFGILCWSVSGVVHHHKRITILVQILVVVCLNARYGYVLICTETVFHQFAAFNVAHTCLVKRAQVAGGCGAKTLPPVTIRRLKRRMLPFFTSDALDITKYIWSANLATCRERNKQAANLIIINERSFNNLPITSYF